MSKEPLLTRGNHKLSKNTLIFNLPAIPEVCGRVCPGCYAAKAQRIFPQVLPSRMRKLEISELEEFPSLIIKELTGTKKPFKYVRIHESGDFNSQSYIDKWTTIAKSFPQYIFYAYTKRLLDFDFTNFKALPNVVLINSLHFNRINYGKPGTEPPGAFICPASKSTRCGIECTYCQTKGLADVRGVWFVKH